MPLSDIIHISSHAPLFSLSGFFRLRLHSRCSPHGNTNQRGALHDACLARGVVCFVSSCINRGCWRRTNANGPSTRPRWNAVGRFTRLTVGRPAFCTKPSGRVCVCVSGYHASLFKEQSGQLANTIQLAFTRPAYRKSRCGAPWRCGRRFRSPGAALFY